MANRVLGMGGGYSPNLTNGAAHVNIRDSSGAEITSLTPQNLSDNVWGTAITKATWPGTSGVAYSFIAVDVTDYADSINLVSLLAAALATSYNVDVGWSSTGAAADIHTTDTAQITTHPNGGVLLTKKDNFLHVIATQTDAVGATVEDAYIYINGRDRS